MACATAGGVRHCSLTLQMTFMQNNYEISCRYKIMPRGRKLGGGELNTQIHADG